MAKTKNEAIAAYKFVCDDLAEDLNYNVAAQLYNDCMEGIGSQRRIAIVAAVTARSFVEDFWSEWKRLHPTERKGNYDPATL